MSSFRKRHIQKPISGTRTSPLTGQVITSSGNPSLDTILGGGLPIGSICLIEEDKFRIHSKVLAKYFLAEGILSLHSVFLGSLDDDPNTVLHNLPKPLDEHEVETEKMADDQTEEAPKNGLRIAWRYNDLPLVNSEQTTAKIGHHFNLSELMDPMILDYVNTTVWNDGNPNKSFGTDEDSSMNSNQNVELENFKNSSISDTSEMERTESEEETGQHLSNTNAIENLKIFENAKYARVFHKLHTALREDKCATTSPGQRVLSRICITSLGSPLWYDDNFPKDILKFLTMLRAAIHNTAAVCLITIPMFLVEKIDTSLVAKIRNLVDFSIELESFAGSQQETNPAFKEYNGLLHLRKIAAINTLSAHLPETSDLAFKLRRKKFVIEKLHLPPELQDNNNEDVARSADIMPSLSCASTIGTNQKTSLEF